MNLNEFPRPPGDNGIGIHLGTNLQGSNPQRELDGCLDMGMAWALVCNRDPDTVIRTAKLFWENGIMPVNRFHVLVNERFAWADYTKELADALGIHPYVQIYNEPGDNREWKNGKIPNDWLDIFAHKWQKVANAVALAGGLPGLQILSTKELEFVLDVGQAEYDGPFLSQAWFCPHNYGCKFPPNYYNEGEGKSIGVLSFLDFAPVFEGRLGYIPPMIAGEGGWFNPGPPVIDRLFGDLTLQQHADWTAEMFAWFKTGELSNGQATPDYLFAVCPWILSGSGMQGWTDSWWTLMNTIKAVKEMGDFERYQPRPEPEEPRYCRVMSEWMPEHVAEDLRDRLFREWHDFGWALEERNDGA